MSSHQARILRGERGRLVSPPPQKNPNHPIVQNPNDPQSHTLSPKLAFAFSHVSVIEILPSAFLPQNARVAFPRPGYTIQPAAKLFSITHHAQAASRAATRSNPSQPGRGDLELVRGSWSTVGNDAMLHGNACAECFFSHSMRVCNPVVGAYIITGLRILGCIKGACALHSANGLALVLISRSRAFFCHEGSCKCGMTSFFFSFFLALRLRCPVLPCDLR